MPKSITGADYQAIVESAPEAVIVYAQGKFLYLNAFAAERLGASSDELVGQSIMDFVHPESVPLVLSRLKQLEETGLAGLLAEVKFVARDGAVIPAEVVSIPIKFQGADAVLGLIRDIQLRSEAQRALRESEERFGNAFRYSPHGMGIVGLDGKFLRVNKSLCEMVGYSENELRELSTQDVSHPDDVAGDVENVQRLITGEINSYNRVKRYFRKDGTMIWVSLAVSAVHDAAGHPLYLIGQVQDITAQRQMEAEAARAERVAGIVEATIAVAHEMNNVLTVLVMNSELLAEDASPEEIPQIAAEILAASQRIAATVQRLRNITDPKSVDYLGERKMIDLSRQTPVGSRKI